MIQGDQLCLFFLFKFFDGPVKASVNVTSLESVSQSMFLAKVSEIFATYFF